VVEVIDPVADTLLVAAATELAGEDPYPAGEDEVAEASAAAVARTVSVEYSVEVR